MFASDVNKYRVFEWLSTSVHHQVGAQPRLAQLVHNNHVSHNYQVAVGAQQPRLVHSRDMDTKQLEADANYSIFRGMFVLLEKIMMYRL